MRIRLRGRTMLVVDVVLAVVLIVTIVLQTGGSPHAPQPWAYLVGAVWMAFVALRSTAPFVAALGAAAGSLAYAFLPDVPAEGGFASFVAILTVVFTVGSRLSGRRRWIAVAALLVCAYSLQILTGTRVPQAFLDTYASPVVLVAVPLLAGMLLQRSRGQTARLERLQAELSAEREAHAAAAAAEERNRIARELHDVIAHSVSVMVVQAGAAQLRLPPGSPATEQLDAVRSTGKQALGELRRQLGVLRTDDPTPSPTAIPTLADLVRLREPGVDIDCDVDRIGEVPPGLAQTVFRLVQEALTNARRHATGAWVSVRVTRDADQLVVDVVNGRGGEHADLGSPESGHGLRGMAERVDLYAGRLETGPTADGGWRVSARLPIMPAEAVS